MIIEDDAGNITEVRAGAFISESNQKKKKGEDKYGLRVRLCDVPPLAEVENFHLDLE